MKERDFTFVFKDRTLSGEEMTREQLFEVIAHFMNKCEFLESHIDIQNTYNTGPVH